MRDLRPSPGQRRVINTAAVAGVIVVDGEEDDEAVPSCRFGN